MENVACDGLVCVVFGEAEVEVLVDPCYLTTAGEFIYTGSDGPGGEFSAVVFVLDVAEYFLDEVFEGD